MPEFAPGQVNVPDVADEEVEVFNFLVSHRYYLWKANACSDRIKNVISFSDQL